jgi:hypothetical protein
MITEDDTVTGPRVCPACGTPASDATFLYCTECGARLDGEERALVHVPKGSRAAALLEEEDEQTKGGSWWKRHRRLLIIGTVAVLAVGAGGFVTWQWTGFRTADAPVRSFFAALEDRDGPAAAALLGEAAFLNSDVRGTDEEILASPLWQAGALDAGYTPPDLESVNVDYFLDAKGVEQRPDKSMASATARFTVDGEAFDMEFLMQRETEGLDRIWAIGSVTMGLVPIGGSGGDVKIANVAVDGGVHAPPGLYEVTVTGSALFADAAGQVMIGGEDYADGSGGDAAPADEPSAIVSTGSPDGYDADEYDDLLGGDETPLDGSSWNLVTTSNLEYHLDPGAAATVDEQIRTTIDACAAPHGLDLEACPFVPLGLDETVAPSIVSALEGGSEWTVTAYPEIELVVDAAGRVGVQVIEVGTATGTYLGPEEGQGLSLPWEDYEAELIPYGSVTVDDGQVVWTYTP